MTNLHTSPLEAEHDLARGGIARPRFKIRRGARPQQVPSNLPQSGGRNSLNAAPLADPQPVSDLDAQPISLAKGGVIPASDERVRGSIDVPMDADGAKNIEQVAQKFASKG